MNVVVYIGSSKQLIGWAWYYWRSTKRKEIDRKYILLLAYSRAIAAPKSCRSTNKNFI